jgi:hypothetical protein
MAVTGRTICTDAMRELNLLNAADTMSGDDAGFVLSKLARVIDNLNAERAGVYARQITTHALTPALQPHTIGLSGATFSGAQAPQEIEAANLIIGTARYPICLHDAGWWMTLTDPELSGDQPTDLWYEPTWPNGSIYLWPVPASAHTLELLTRIRLSALTLTSDFVLPPGYQDAITLTLAEEIAPAFGVQVPGIVVRNASKARARVMANNDVTPSLDLSEFNGGSAPPYNIRIGR